MKILVIGNGSAGIDDKQNIFINNHTGHFLLGLKKKFAKVSYCGFVTQYNKDSNLLNFNLKGSGIGFIPVAKGSKLFLLAQITKLFVTHLWHYDFFYFFFPGSLGRFIAFLAILSGKDVAFYVRGQLFSDKGIDRYILRKAKFILTVSPSIKDRLLRVNSRIEVIKPMISLTKADFYHERKFISKDYCRLLFVGRIEYRKGILELIAAFEILKRNIRNIELVLVGGGDLLKELKTKQSQGEISNAIVFTGLISDKNKLLSEYRKADLFVFPSHDEGFPRVIYDAMSQMLPILTTMVGGIPGYMKNEYNCIELQTKDENKIAATIEKAIKNEELQSSIAANAMVTLDSILQKPPHEELLINQTHKL